MEFQSRPKLKEELFIAPMEAEKLLKGAEALGLEWLVPIYVTRSLGLRVTELIHIRIRDLQFDHGRLWIWTAKNKQGRQPVECSCNGYRDNKAVRDAMSMKPQLAQVLKGWIEYRRLGGDDWLFPSPRDRMRHLTRGRIAQVFDEASREGNVQKVRRRGVHSLRHLVGTEVAELTKDPYKVQRVLRQRSITSAESYVHVRNIDDVMSKIGEREERKRKP